MKKSFFTFMNLILLSIFLMFSGCFTKNEHSVSMSVARTSTEMFGNSYVQNLTIVLSTASIPDFEACAMEIVEHCMYNTFSDIQFSYDVIGYPSKLQGTVYLNDMDFAQNNVLFSFSYAPCQTMTGPYNIVQNQRSYQLTIH